MLRLLIIITIITQSFSSFSQDYIIVRNKAGRTIKRIFTGFNIEYETRNGNYVEGPIADIRNDSIFTKAFLIQERETVIGVVLHDTINTYLVGNHYQNMRKIKLYERREHLKSFGREKAEQLLMLGGAGYFLLNILNGALLKEPITSRNNLRTLKISAGAFGLGLFLNKLGVKSQYTTKKHKIIYVDL